MSFMMRPLYTQNDICIYCMYRSAYWYVNVQSVLCEAFMQFIGPLVPIKH